jgi:ubiquinone/menaquinone biosynthesis C-methylase UbiE
MVPAPGGIGLPGGHVSDVSDNTADGDHWSEIRAPEEVAHAIGKLESLAAAPSVVEARRRYLDLLSPRPGEMVVEVGAGAGTIAIDIARRVAPGGRVFAADPSEGLLARARARAAEAEVGHLLDCRVADGRSLPFGPAAFDAAFCHWVLLHVDQPATVIAEMRRVTRRGGRVMCVEMDWETMTVHPGATGLTRQILHHSIDRSRDGWSGRRLAGYFRQCGLVDVMVEPIVDVDQGGANRAWFDFMCERADLARDAGVISPEEATAWTAELEEAHAAGNFFFSITQFAVLARVPA